MLETIREYALERLAQSDEEATLRRRHAEYFVALAERADLELRGPKQRMWVNRLDTDHDNLRAVLAWSLRGQPEAGTTWEGALELGLRLAGALEVFWTERNHMSEAVAWIEGGLERSRDSAVPLPPSVRAQALIAAGQFAAARYDHTRAIALLEESLALFRTLGDRTRMAFALVWLGRLARDQGDYGRAERLEEESLALFRSRGDAWGINLALLSLADVALDTGAPDRAKTYLQEAHAISQDLGPTHWRIWPTYNLGLTAYLQGDYAQALDHLEKSLAQFRKLDHPGAAVLTLLDLGKVAHAQGDNSRAAHYFAEGLALNRKHMSRGGAPGRDLEERGLEGLAGVAAAQEQPERAARLFGAAEALREVIGEPLAPAYRAAHERDVAAVRALLGDATFEAAWAEGRSMTLEQAIAYALEAGQ
jgi:tetratricopeptide (TPR) repeat protein